MAHYPQIQEIVERAGRTLATREYSRRTRTAYLTWIRHFLTFHRAPHPDQLDRRHAEQFLEHLKVDRDLAAKTRNQAASAIAFLYRELLANDAMERVPRAKGRRTVPVVLSRREAVQVLQELRGKYWLIGALLYGTGMRLDECLSLRVKDLDFELSQIAVRAGKGGSNRFVPLPDNLRKWLKQQVQNVRQLIIQDRRQGAGWARLPGALHRKDPDAGYSLAWQFLFPASRLSVDRATDKRGRDHLNATAMQKRMKQAVLRSQIPKRITCHSLRHSFATQMLRDGCDVRTVQKLMGHRSIRTTQIYLHATDQVGIGVRSPIDRLVDMTLEPATTPPSPQ